jgi:hypothetical protein
MNEAKQKWIKRHDLKINSKVRVAVKPPDNSSCWVSDMDSTIGDTYLVSEFNFDGEGDGIVLSNGYIYPYYTLVPVIQTQKLKVQKPKYKPYTKTMTLKQIREFYQKGG